MDGELKIRPRVQGADDDACLVVHNRIADERRDGSNLTREQLEASRRSPGFDPRGKFVAELEGRVVGIAGGQVNAWSPAREGFVSASVLPELRRRHIGSALLQTVVQDLGARAARKAVADVPEENIAGCALARSLGFKTCRVDTKMRRPLDQLPTGVGENTAVDLTQLGTSDDDIRLLVSLLNETNQDYPGYSPVTFEQMRLGADSCAKRGVVGWTFVARMGGEPVGLVTVDFDPHENERTNRSRGSLYNLGVQVPCRRQGIGTALMLRGMQFLKERSIAEADLEVDDENPLQAIRIYRRLGFEVTGTILSFEFDLPKSGPTS